MHSLDVTATLITQLPNVQIDDNISNVYFGVGENEKNILVAEAKTKLSLLQ
jgi:hypothetical protein